MHFSRFLFVSLLTVFAGCRQPEDEPFSTTYPLPIGDTVLQVQVALQENEVRNGLMHRRSLPDDSGMLFVFPRPRQLRFWMRNTTIPLDVGYFSPDGVLREVYPLYPLNENPVPSRSDQLQFALETNQGWFAQNGLRPGARIDLDAVRDMIRSRGQDPEDFGLAPD